MLAKLFMLAIVEFHKKIYVSYMFECEILLLRGLSFIFRDLATSVLQSANWQLYRKASFLRLNILRMFSHASAIFGVYSNLKDSFRPKNGIKS